MEVFNDILEPEAFANVTGNLSSPWSEQATNSALEDNDGSGGVVFVPWDNPDNIVSSETRELVLFVIDCIFTPIMTTTGVVGNVMSFLVLMHHNMRGAVDVCLAALAVSDTAFLITSMIRGWRCIISSFDFLAAEWFYVRTFNALYFLNAVFSRVTTMITILVTLNRFIAVMYPLKARAWLTRNRMLFAIASIYISCFLIMIPVAMTTKVGEMFDPALNATRPYLASTEMFLANREFLLEYIRNFLVIVFRYIPTVVLVILNVSIIVILKQTSKKRGELSEREVENGNNDGQRKITVMLVVISMLFFVTLIPGNINLIISMVDSRYQYMNTFHNMFMLASGAAFFLEVVNSSVNFIVYMALSTSFNKTYKKLFCGCRGGHKTKPKADGTLSTGFIQNS